MDEPRAHRCTTCASSASPEKEIAGYDAYETFFDDMRIKLRKGARDTWVGDSPSRAELEEILGDQTMIDALFEASISDVLDSFVTDQRLKDALFGQGVIGTFAGPKDPGTASVKLMHFQGDLEGEGPVWGYVKGGMGMISFAIADAAAEAGAVLAAGVPVGEILPGEGVRLDDGTFIAAPGGRQQRGPQAGAEPGRPAGDAGRLPGAAGDLGHPVAGGQVQRRAAPAAVLDGRAGRDVHGAGHRRRDHGSGRTRRPRSSGAWPASPRSGSGRSTCRRCTTRPRRRPAGT